MLSIYQVYELGGTSFRVTFFLSGITVNWFVKWFSFFVLFSCLVCSGRVSCLLGYV